MGLLDRFRRGGQGQEGTPTDSADALYVHLAADGGIFVIRGGSGEQLWVDRDGLDAELQRIKARGGMLLYSREHPDGDPPPVVIETFKHMLRYRLPVKLVEQPHPEAAVPADQRRSITRDQPG